MANANGEHHAHAHGVHHHHHTTAANPLADRKHHHDDDQPRSSHKPDPTDRFHRIPEILPHERVFPIQIGCELFKLSGASISSDAPSYFSQYFKCQIKRAEENGEDPMSAIRTLYIDRDPVTFRDISLHLQGYHVRPRDSTHFVRLFADAQFYNLPKLISQLYEESIFTVIGDREFQIPRDLFNDPGNSPNFFSLGFAAFFSSPDDLFPGLDREGLLRPPSIVPPSVPNRSADTFAELLHLLRGYPVDIRSEAHRAELLRDCRYFNFKGLEQRLIPHAISFNLARGRHEIAIRLSDILKSGVSVAADPTPSDPLAAWVNYARPYVDDRPYELVLEIGGESTRLLFARGGPATHARAEFCGDTRARITRLFEVIANKLNLGPPSAAGQSRGLLIPPTQSGGGGVSSQQHQQQQQQQPPIAPGNTPLSEDLVKVVLDPQASIVLDGRPWRAGGEGWGQEGTGEVGEEEAEEQAEKEDAAQLVFPGAAVSGPVPVPVLRKRRRVDAFGAGGSPAAEWVVKTGQWRLRIQGVRNGKAPVECCLVAVKLDAFSSERARNAQRAFFGRVSGRCGAKSSKDAIARDGGILVS